MGNSVTCVSNPGGEDKELMVNSITPCYNGLGISVQILNSNKYSQDSIYQIFYRNVTRQQEDWCFVDENCVLQFDNFIGRFCLLENLTGGDTYEVETKLTREKGQIIIASGISKAIPLKGASLRRAYRCIKDFKPKDSKLVVAKRGEILLESDKTPDVDLPRDEFCFVENQSNGQFGYVPLGNVEKCPEKVVEINKPLEIKQHE